MSRRVILAIRNDCYEFNFQLVVNASGNVCNKDKFLTAR